MFKHYWNVKSINCGLNSCWNEILTLIADRCQCERVAVRSGCVRSRSADHYSCSNNKQSRTETLSPHLSASIFTVNYLSCPDLALKCVGRERSFDSFCILIVRTILEFNWSGACPEKTALPSRVPSTRMMTRIINNNNTHLQTSLELLNQPLGFLIARAVSHD